MGTALDSPRLRSAYQEPAGPLCHVSVDVHLGPDDLASSVRVEALAGLSGSPGELSLTCLYDETGCRWFEAITSRPEYHPTGAEGSS
jgi:uncharacterized SAM-dependent methyltransferase